MIDLVIASLLRYLSCLTKMRTVGQNPLMVELDDEDQNVKHKEELTFGLVRSVLANEIV